VFVKTGFVFGFGIEIVFGSEIVFGLFWSIFALGFDLGSFLGVCLHFRLVCVPVCVWV